MDRLPFTGIQNIDKGDIKLDGYIQVLPGEDHEAITSIKGLINVHDDRNFTHDFRGKLIHLLIDELPKIEIYTQKNMGDELFYAFKNPTLELNNKKIIYPGIWCYLTPENRNAVAHLLVPPNSRRASLEFSFGEESKKLLDCLGLLG
jgi:hypothetical protein